jgi:hypothetical protein
LYYKDERRRRSSSAAMRRRRIAVNIAKLPELTMEAQ